MRDLQESLRKRNPDSVSNLVRAAALSEESQAERKQLELHVQNARAELKEAQEDFEMRLRSLRQEHERVKAQYIKRIEDLEAVSTVTPVKTAISRGSTPGSGEKGKDSPKTLAAAQARIKELEAEAERIRVFYTKKVEEEKRKGEAQIAALKRGQSDGKPEDGLSYGGSDARMVSSTGDDMPAVAAGRAEIAVADQIQNALAALRVEYEAKIALLTTQLKVAQEAAEPKKEAGAPAIAAVTVADVLASSVFREEVSKEVAARISMAPTGTSALDRQAHEHALRMAEQKGQLEAEALRMRLREEEHKCQLQQHEIATLRSQVQSQASHATPAAFTPSGPFISQQTLQTLETQTKFPFF